MGRMLRTQEAADLLSLNKRTLDKWRSTGGGPRYTKLNGAVRYSEADIAEFIERGRRRSTADRGPRTVGR